MPKAFALPRDSDDEIYLNLAIAADARYLVTWNERHLTYLLKADTPEGAEFGRRYPNLTILDPPALLAALSASPLSLAIIAPMFRLTREVRFSIGTDVDDDQLDQRPTNSYAGYPSFRGLGHYFRLRATVAGELDPASNYLVNIKQIDQVVRERAIPFVRDRIGGSNFFGDGSRVVSGLMSELGDAWRPAALERLELCLTPFLSISCHTWEHPMVRLSQKFEFSASHRLHNPALSDDDNRRAFGKCNNPHGHGHNYELQVTLRGTPGDSGLLIDVPAFEQIVADTVIDRFDHKNLNLELPEFRELIPSVENIARVIYGLLKPRFERERATLASVIVWETPKTWCEYSE